MKSFLSGKVCFYLSYHHRNARLDRIQWKNILHIAQYVCVHIALCNILSVAKGLAT